MGTEIIKPENFLTVRQPIVFGVERDTTTVTEIVVDQYVKQAEGNSLTVNVSDYCKVQLETSPLVLGDGEITPYDGMEVGRLASVSVSITDDDTHSELVYAVASGMDKLPQKKFLTDIKRRPYCNGLIDELSAVSEETEVPLYMAFVDSLDTNPEPSYVPITGSAGVQYKSFGLRLSGDKKKYAVLASSPTENTYEILDTVEFVPTDNISGVRMCWINKYGCLDYWNFEVVRTKSVKASKTRIYSASGYIVTDVEAEEENTVRAKPMDAKTMEALSWIASSTVVWIVKDDGTYEPVDVTSTSATTYSSSSPSSLEIKYRPKLMKI